MFDAIRSRFLSGGGGRRIMMAALACATAVALGVAGGRLASTARGIEPVTMPCCVSVWGCATPGCIGALGASSEVTADGPFFECSSVQGIPAGPVGGCASVGATVQCGWENVFDDTDCKGTPIEDGPVYEAMCGGTPWCY